MIDDSFYKNRKVLITGHTGFKGSWLCMILSQMGAKVIGYSLEPASDSSLFKIANIESRIQSNIGDVRDIHRLSQVFEQNNPEIVIHMAAQPLVRESYLKPLDTYETNVMGTIHVLECARKSKTVKSLVNVTTDKVYDNKECMKGYVETDRLDGYDPYSNSKSCSELVTHCYNRSFLKAQGIAVSTCRAGNVIGGGDFAKDRIIPDCIRAVTKKETILLRNPSSIRPYQHVLEPLSAYLLVASEQLKDRNRSGTYNIGPNEESCITTGEITTLFCNKWGDDAKWEDYSNEGPHESNLLKLDSSKIKNSFGWKPKWEIDEALERVIQWEKCYQSGGDIESIMRMQIEEYYERK